LVDGSQIYGCALRDPVLASGAFPLAWAVCTSFKTNLEFYRDAWALPETLAFENYATAWVKGKSAELFNPCG
jgi:ABC-type glycerol-3-phosphate transport system permease component